MGGLGEALEKRETEMTDVEEGRKNEDRGNWRNFVAFSPTDRWRSNRRMVRKVRESEMCPSK